MRKQVIIVGNTNSGKSALFNALCGQDRSIVSGQPGTTTDPVQTTMELIPFGPIVLIDSAGLNDQSALGNERIRKTIMVQRRADAAIYAADPLDFNRDDYHVFRKREMPHILVFSKADMLEEMTREALMQEYPHAVLVSSKTGTGIKALQETVAALLSVQHPDEESLIRGLLSAGDTAIMVVPADSEAPKGRLILPQAAVLRDCLDHNIKTLVCRETELEQALEELKKTDLVITDSQIFGFVNRILPREIPLTSFSMLFARQKGNFTQLVKGAEILRTLPDGGEVLMLEGCTHNHTHEDIGRMQIPDLLRKKTGKSLRFHFYSGYDFPEALSPYCLAIQCGCCMLNKREVGFRLAALERLGIPATNYGMVLAWAYDILDRSLEIFRIPAAR
jgi:[FeFe] hydrogenase H-cluster maturation GTPase HydF